LSTISKRDRFPVSTTPPRRSLLSIRLESPTALKAHVPGRYRTASSSTKVGPARLETAADSRVARDQRAAGEHDHVASDVRPAELAARDDVERAARSTPARFGAVGVSSCVVSVVFVVLRVGALGLQHDRREDGGK
jgi:hypothetical protein